MTGLAVLGRPWDCVTVPFDLPESPSAPLLLHGDCLDLLAGIPDASIDVVITDPPSALHFMGKEWDMFDRYEPRTPKGREIAARLGRDDLIRRAANMLLGLSLSERTEGLPAREEAAALAAELRDRAQADAPLPPWAIGFVAFLVDVWSEVDRVLKPGAFVCAWALPKTADLAGLAMRAVGWTVTENLLHLFGEGMSKAGDLGKKIDKLLGVQRDVVGSKAGQPGYSLAESKGATVYCSGIGGTGDPIRECQVTAPATPEAERWTDWSSQLAPGHEQWLLARKPTPLTYAKQVLEHGCGALNIGACRVPRGDDRKSSTAGIFTGEHSYGDAPRVGYKPHGGGSWPKNVMLTEGGEHCPVAMLDEQAPATGGHGGGRHTSGSSGASWAVTATGLPIQSFHDGQAGASRFFTRFRYQAKNTDRRAGTRRDMVNDHPTPKSLDLMRWLVRLLAAKAEHTGGAPAIVLDIFGGSGTTAVACIAEQVRCVLMERDRKSIAITRARVAAAVGDPEAAVEANAAAPVGGQLTLL